MPYNSYKNVSRFLDHKDEINFIFKRITNGIHRRLTTKQTFRNPFTFKFIEPIRRFIFYVILDVVTSYTNKNGEKYHLRKTVTNTTITIEFFNLFSVHHAFINLRGTSSCITCFEKLVRKCTVNLVVDEYNPLILKYNPNKELVTVSGHFEVKNELGNICSFES